MTGKSELLIDQFLQDLKARAPFSDVDYAGGEKIAPHRLPDLRFDGEVRLAAPGGVAATLCLHVMGSAYPRDVKQIAAWMKQWRESAESSRTYPIAIAEMLSPGARELLREQGISYFDASGTMFINMDGWLIDVERASKRKPRRPAALFSGAREQVVHALLYRWWQARKRPQDFTEDGYFAGTDIVDLSRTSPYTVSQTLKELDLEEIVESTGSGPHQRRRLQRPAALLDSWAQSWRLRRDPVHRYYWYGADRNLDAFAAIADGRQGWLVTGAAAANKLAPTLTRVQSVELIVPSAEFQGRRFEELQGLLASNGMEPADKGANVYLIERNGTALQFDQPDPASGRIQMASPFIQYLDLLNGQGRNKELAASFRRSVLLMEEDEA